MGVTIKLTDEMSALYDRAYESYDREGCHSAGMEAAVRTAVALVIEIVERDYNLTEICGEELTPGIRCRQTPGHSDEPHWASGPNRSVVAWE